MLLTTAVAEYSPITAWRYTYIYTCRCMCEVLRLLNKAKQSCSGGIQTIAKCVVLDYTCRLSSLEERLYACSVHVCLCVLVCVVFLGRATLCMLSTCVFVCVGVCWGVCWCVLGSVFKYVWVCMFIVCSVVCDVYVWVCLHACVCVCYSPGSSTVLWLYLVPHFLPVTLHLTCTYMYLPSFLPSFLC